MKRMLVCLLALSLAMCKSPALQVDQTDNRSFEVEELFSHAGCTVYRFEDGGDRHYFAVCHGGSYQTTTPRQEVCGKGCVRNVDDVLNIEMRP